MRRLLPLLLLLLLPLSLLSCGDVPTEEEVLPAAEQLIRASLLLNTVYLGEGIPAGEVAFGDYSYADKSFCEQNGLMSVAALKEKTEEVYTAEVAADLYRMFLTTDSETLGDYRDLPTAGEGLYVRTARTGWYRDMTHEYLFETMTLEDSSKSGATVSLTVRITPEGLEPQERRLSLPLVLGEDGWRCHKLTYIAYDPSQN